MEAALQTYHYTYPLHQRHEPEKTVLYEAISQNWKTFLGNLETDPESFGIPKYVKNEMKAYLKCGLLQHGFLRVHCESCQKERLVAFSCKKRGFCPSCGGRRMSETAARLNDHVFPEVNIRQWVLSLPMPLRYWLSSNPKLISSVLEILIRALKQFHLRKVKGIGFKRLETGSVTFIQRFGSALNLNIHFHILFLDGVYSKNNDDANPTFHPLPAPTDKEIKNLVEWLATRITRHLKRKGYLNDNAAEAHESDELSTEKNSLIAACVAASIQNKIALGNRAGHYVRKIGVHPLEAKITGYRSAAINGFSLHGGVSIKAKDRHQLERLIRYVARPSVALERLKWTSDGNLTYQLKRAFSDGTTHILFSPMELMEKLVALIPQPKIHLIRYHGVLAPHAKWRSLIVPKQIQEPLATTNDSEKKASRSKRISWAELLKRVFNIDVSTCSTCQGKVKVVAAILEIRVIEKILNHLKLPTKPPFIHPARAPPDSDSYFDTF